MKLLFPSRSACHLHVPNGTGIQLCSRILVEKQRRRKAIRVQAQLLEKIYLDQRIYITIVIVVFPCLFIVTGVVSGNIRSVHGILKLLIVFADIADCIFSSKFRALDVERNALSGRKSVCFVNLIVVQLQQIAAGNVSQCRKAFCIEEADAVFILCCVCCDRRTILLKNVPIWPCFTQKS